MDKTLTGDKPVSQTQDAVSNQEHSRSSVEGNSIITTLDKQKQNNPALEMFPSSNSLLGNHEHYSSSDGSAYLFCHPGTKSDDNFDDKAPGIDDKPSKSQGSSSSDKSQFPVVQPGQHPFSAADIAARGKNGIDQQGHGDCVFEASAAALAGTQKGQEQIANMITQGQNGDYIVKFPGESKPVTVTQADLNDPKLNNSESAWGKILESAFVKSHPDTAEGKLPDGESRTLAQYDMNILTGNTPNKIDANDKNAAPDIQKALENGNPVVAFCKDKDNGALVDGHEWTVSSYDPKTQEITVRNPWGNFHGTEQDGIQDIGNGEVKMPYSTFQKYFGEVTSPGLPNQAPSFWNQVADNLNPMNWF